MSTHVGDATQGTEATAATAMPLRLSAIRDAWNGFWFGTESSAVFAFFRIAYGLVLVCWGLSVVPDVVTFFSDEGIYAEPSYLPWFKTLLQINDSPAAAITVLVVLIVSAAATMVGYRTRLATVVLFLALLSLERRNAFVLNNGDRVLLNLGFWLMFLPAGAALSVDRWRNARDRFWESPRRSAWPLRLIQVQMSTIYLFTVFYKVRGEPWYNGTAMWYPWRIGDIARFTPPDFLLERPVFVNLGTWGTLAIEFALATLIWSTRWRPWVICAGIVLHVAIDLTMLIGFFSLAMYVGYFSFVQSRTAERWVAAIRRRVDARTAPASITAPEPVEVAT